MTPLPISDIIRDSFKRAWRFKYLWLFGLFAGGGGFNIPTSGETGPEQIEELKAWFLAALAMIILIGFIIMVILLTLHAISKTALIYNAYQIETGGAHSLSGGWDFGLKRFWLMLALTLTQVFVIMATVLIVVIVEVILFASSVALGFLSLLLAIPAFLALIAVVVLTWGYAERFLVLENRGFLDSIGEGWSLLKSEWRSTLTMGVVKIAIAIAVGLGIVGVGLVLVLPAVGLWAVSKPLAILYGVAIIGPLVLISSAYFGTFDSLVWTKVFLHLRAPSYAGAISRPAVAPPPAPPDQHPSSPPMFE